LRQSGIRETIPFVWWAMPGHKRLPG